MAIITKGMGRGTLLLTKGLGRWGKVVLDQIGRIISAVQRRTPEIITSGPARIRGE